MQLKWQQIATIKKETLKPLYILCGRDSFYLQQATNELRNVVLTHGATLSQTLFIDAAFDWSAWYNDTQNINLFSEITLYIMYANDAALSKAAKEYLALAAQERTQSYIILIVEKLNPKDAWLKPWEGHYAQVTFYELKGQAFIEWLRHFSEINGVSIKPPILKLIADITFESPRLAAHLILKCQSMPEPIDEACVKAIFSSDKEANIFDLQQALVEKNVFSVQRHFKKLVESNTPLSLMSWLIRNELQRLIKLKFASDPSALVHRLGIHFSQKQRYLKNAHAIDSKLLLSLYPQTADIDKCIVRSENLRAYELIQSIILELIRHHG